MFIKLLLFGTICAVLVDGSANSKNDQFGKTSFYSHKAKAKSNRIPYSFDLRNVNGINYLSSLRNQDIPNYCGSGWAIAVTSALGDRFRYQRGGSWPTHELAAQVLINCDTLNNGCSGGDPYYAYRYIYEYGIPDESCLPLTGTEERCIPMNMCRSCTDNGICDPVYDYTKYSISHYGHVSSEFFMKSEIYHNGTITCTIGVTSGFRNYRRGIFSDSSGSVLYTHTVSIVGWGEEYNIPYWIVRNSWGSYWGESGFARVLRGHDLLGIESDCSWGQPEFDGGFHRTSNGGDSQRMVDGEFSQRILNGGNTPRTPNGEFSQQTNSEHSQRILNGGNSPRTLNGKHSPTINIRNFVSCGYPTDWTIVQSVVISPLPSTYVNVSALPSMWDIRSLYGRNYATPNKNQHSPQFCNSCWAQATAAALADRLNIRNQGKWPLIELSAQTILNCASGSCQGGDTGDAYRYAYLYGITDRTCQAYEGKKKACDSMGICMDCNRDDCWAVESYRKVYVEEYGEVQGIDNMKAEIYARGPITCFMVMTEEFMNYQGGIFVEHDHAYKGGHIVEVAGWGYNAVTKQHYWIARNNWGNLWGEEGWFRIHMGGSNLMIESSCSWGVPSASFVDVQSIVSFKHIHTPNDSILLLALLLTLSLSRLISNNGCCL